MRWLPLLVLAGCDRVFLGEAPKQAIDAPAVVDAMDICPSTYETVGTLSSRYRILESFEALATQRARCRADDPRYTHLVVFETATEMGDIRIWIDDKPAATNDYLYVGAVQASGATQLREGWSWVSTKAVIDDALWLSNEPDDSDRVEDHLEDAAVVFRKNAIGLIDIPVSYELRAVCECDGIPEM